jgi:hypothetical protein
MRARLQLPLSAALFLSLAGCVKTYEPPALNEPHALLKLRRVFHSAPGQHRRLRILVEDEQLLGQEEPSTAAPAETTATRVRPGASRVTFEATFWHTEMRQVSETYTEQVPYIATETYTETVNEPCSSPSPFPCTRQETRTRTVTKYRSETKTRWVWKEVDVIDDYCKRFAVQLFERDHTYALQYTYTGASRCGITCLEQFVTATPEGSAFQPCHVPP